MSAIYFWKDGEVIMFSSRILTPMQADEVGVLDLPCVDTSYLDSKDEFTARYGKFVKNEWQGCRPEQLPAEFRAALLLLGVT